MTVVRFPILTMQDVVPRDWDPILTLPLPKNPSLELLDVTRRQVLLYLDWIMHEMVQIDDSWTVRRELERATDRLLEIAAALPAALEAHAERCLTSIRPENLAEITGWVCERESRQTREGCTLHIIDGDLT
jgi:hypothetical protein